MRSPAVAGHAALAAVLLALAGLPSPGSAQDRPMTAAIRGLDGPAEIPLERVNGRLAVPVTLHGERGSREVFFHLDTGTLVPVMWLPEVREAVGALDSVSLGPVTVERPVTGTYSAVDALRRDLERTRGRLDRLPDRPGGGIVGWTLMSKAILSIDVPGGRLVLRPPGSERRTLYGRDPIASVDYRPLRHNVWIPARVHGDSGYVHLDSGYSYTWVEESVAGGPPAFRVGGVDLLPHLENAELRPEEQGPAYRSVPLDVIANLGVDALDRIVVTIDASRNRVYFEEPDPGGPSRERGGGG